MKTELENSLRYWNGIHEENDYKRDNIKMDDWLELFDDVIDKCDTPVLDLGCGSGNDTLYLINKDKSVISCDLSPKAIELIRRNFPEVDDTRCVNMLEGLPFDDDTFEVIVADLCLHYFLEQDTINIINDLKRVLKKDGYIILRVNSINDVNHGAGQGKEVEKHVFETEDGRLKRFFDEQDIRFFFKDFIGCKLLDKHFVLLIVDFCIGVRINFDTFFLKEIDNCVNTYI